MGRVHWLRLAALAALAALLGSCGFLLLPGTVLAGDPPCASLYPSIGPGGVDLRAACAANEVAEHYTASGSPATGTLWDLALILLAAWMAAVVALAIWRAASRRAARRLAPVTPDTHWLCDACRSFNDGDATVCYRCRRPRPDGARVVDAGDRPTVDQTFGRPFGT